MSSVAILVTGSRDWTDRGAVARVLIPYNTEYDLIVLIHGDNGEEDEEGFAKRGLDRLARDVAIGCGYEIEAYPASQFGDWPSCGPKRNAAMVQRLLHYAACGFHAVVHAFPLPGSKGTWDCVRKARANGFTVKEHGGLRSS